MRKHNRRKTDPTCPLARLSQADREELRLLNLSRDVTAACVAFFKDRGMPSQAWVDAMPYGGNQSATTGKPAPPPPDGVKRLESFD